MHHVALDRAGPHDRDLDHEVVEGRAASAAAASTSARGFRSGTCPACRPCGSSRRSPGPRPGWSRGRAARLDASSSRSKARRMQPSMPRPSTSTFMNLSASMSSLSHSMTWRSSIAAGSIGTSSSSRSRVSTKPPGCWRQMARECRSAARASSSVSRSRRSSRLRLSSAACSLGDALLAPAPDLRRRARRSRPRAGPAPCRLRAPRRARGSG